MKNTIVNQQKRLAQAKINDERNRKIQAAQRDNSDRALYEESMRIAKAEEVSNMERIEMQLIKKLQNTQAIQKEAIMEMEKAQNVEVYKVPHAKLY